MKNIESPLLRSDEEAGKFLVNRRSFTDPQVLDAEMRAVFDTCWLYVGHGSEIRKPGSFVTRSVGGRNLIFNRDATGQARSFLNSCPHRGATVCRERAGNAKNFTCGYHGWVFGADGKNRNVPGIEAYAPGFGSDGCNDLVAVPRLESHRDFWFVCFDRDAQPLSDYLAGAKEYLDIVADQCEAGMEIVGGAHDYSIGANWKLLVENSIDGYHAPVTHSTYLDYLRNANEGHQVGIGVGAAKDLGNGHAVIEFRAPWGRPISRWVPSMGEEAKPQMEAQRARLEQLYGKERADRIAGMDRNLLIFPNLCVLDILAITVRTFYPRAPDRMDVTGWAMGPIGESSPMRRNRLNNFLEFLGPGGFATPDDVEMLEQCQKGYANAKEAGWNDISRGMRRQLAGKPGGQQDELQMRTFWRRWHDLVVAGGAVATREAA
jgi:p-cumate 2,3-dioxygenase alpha subunit